MTVTVGRATSLITGSRKFKFDGQPKSAALAPNMFFARYRRQDIWSAEVKELKVETRRQEESGLWFDDVIVTILLANPKLYEVK